MDRMAPPPSNNSKSSLRVFHGRGGVKERDGARGRQAWAHQGLWVQPCELSKRLAKRLGGATRAAGGGLDPDVVAGARRQELAAREDLVGEAHAAAAEALAPANHLDDL